jgi:hypothetical protein
MRMKIIPPLFLAAVAVAMLWYGPIAQMEHYHEFADTRSWLGIPNAGDVLSNAGFFIVGIWGFWTVRGRHHSPGIARSWPGYRVFLVAITLTAFGSSYYHWAPDNARLLWDRIPINLACAGLISAVYADTHERSPRWLVPALVVYAIASCLYWSITDRFGVGDLRPYLYMQAALVLTILWQWIYGAPRGDKIAFGLAIVLYGLAKGFELADHQVFEALGFMSGHTIKHLLSVGATIALTVNLARKAAKP